MAAAVSPGGDRPFQRKHGGTMNSWVLRYCYCTLGVLVLLVVSANAQVPAVRADFVRASSRAAFDESVIVEHGHHLFSEDGRVRKDTFRGGWHVTEIVLPPASAANVGPESRLGKRLRVDHTSRLATWSQTGYSAPKTGGGDLPPCSLQDNAPHDQGSVTGGPIGECTIGPFVLMGFADARVHPDSGDAYLTQWWFFVNTPTEELAEKKTVTSEGHVDALRLTRVTRIIVPEHAFEIPAGYRVVDFREWHGLVP